MNTRNWMGAVCVGALLSLVPTTARTAPQNQQQKAPNRSVDEQSYQALSRVQDPASKLKLLDTFVAKHPDSALLPSVYRDYSIAYFMMKNFPESVAYADKFLAHIDEAGPGILRDGMFGGAQRLDGLYVRAQAYFAGCTQDAFHTREAYTNARDTAAEGLQALDQWPKPPDMRERQFRSMKEQVGNRFRAVAAIADSGLEGNHPLDACKSLFAPDPEKFNQMIDQINAQPQP